MTKKSRKRPARFEKQQSGCMWSLINIFDFRHGAPSQKLLPDRKHTEKRIASASYPEITLESLANSCEVRKEPNASAESQTPTINSSKMSVKELMEEEIVSDQDQEKRASIVIKDTKWTTKGDENHIKRSHGRTRSKIDLDSDAFVLAEEVSYEHTQRKNDTGSAALSAMVEEFCSCIHQKDASRLELANRSIEDSSAIEEKLCDATKVLVDHFTDGKSFNRGGKIQSSRELVDALQILNSNKDVFLKLLKEPNSLLAKHIQNLQDIQAEEGKFKVLTESDILDQNSGNGKPQNFFWRRFKGLERISSKKSESSEDLNRIVVLKPSPLGSRCSDMAISCGSLPESPRSITDKAQIERVPSYFSFTELKRKLKQAMRKETIMINRDKKIGGETVPMASPSRDHFFIERIPRLCPVYLENETVLSPKRRVPNIYVEAKKHLAEIVGSSDVDFDTRGKKQVPKALGRILSFSGYSSPIICSPRTDGGVRLSLDGKPQAGDVGQESVSGSHVAVDKAVHEPVLEPHLSAELACESIVDKSTNETEICAFEECSIANSPECAVDTDIVRSSDAEFPKESNQIEISSKCSEEKCLSTTLEHEICDESSTSSSFTESTPTCSVSEKIKDVDVMSDATSKPSPVSVLDLVFKEGDISPPSIKSFTVVESFQPRQIRFEAEISSSPEQFSYNRNNIENNKYTFEFVKAVVQMSALTWEELLRRSFFSDHLIDPELIDEVDFLPDLLPCDFNLLFSLINEILIEICRVNFSCTLSFAKPFVKPESKGKDILTEIWKNVDWYLKLDRLTLDQILGNDFAKPETWMDIQLDREGVGIRVQEAILEELLEELMQEREFPGLASDEDTEVSVA